MSNNPQACEFGQFTLFPAEKRLLCDGKAVALAPKVFDTLVLLVENQGRLIPKEELLQVLWPDSFVEEVALAHNISQLRKALRDTTEQPRFIETVPKRGYRFIAAVRQMGKLATQVAGPTRGGIVPSAIQNFRWFRPAVWAAFAAMLVLVAGAAAYVYLQRISRTVSGGSPAIHSLAVLPLENLSGDKEQEYFADGMTDELITELGKIGALRVISRTSVMQYKAVRRPLSDIASELNVDAVVEGTVLRSGNRVRITAQLVRTAAEKHLWAESYESDLNDVLTLQRNVAQGIAREIRIKLSPQEQSAPSRPVNSEAYHLYLKGRYHHAKVTRSGFLTAISYFKRAIEIDPTYAFAYAGLADVYREMPFAGYAPSKESFPMAKAAALRALQIDPVLAEAHVVLGWVYFCYEWNWSEAEIELKRAIELNPNSSDAYLAYAHLLSNLGRGDEALQKMKSARELDPLHLMISSLEGQFLFYAKRYDEAAMQHRKTLEMDSNFWPARQGLARVFIQRGMYREAISELRDAIKLSPGATEPITQLGYALAKSGNRAEARATLGSLRELAAREYVPAYNFAMIYNGLGEKEKALKYLQASVEEREVHMTFANVDTRWDELRKDAAFRNLMRRVGFQH